jgi:hypothetical protein
MTDRKRIFVIGVLMGTHENGNDQPIHHHGVSVIVSTSPEEALGSSLLEARKEFSLGWIKSFDIVEIPEEMIREVVGSVKEEESYDIP